MKKTRIDFVFAAGKLKDLREKKGLSVAQLAKAIGVDRSLVTKWESKMCSPSFEKVRELSYFFGVNDDYWKLSEKPKIKTNNITEIIFGKNESSENDYVYKAYSFEDDIISKLEKRIVFLEEKIETLTKHDDELKLKCDILETDHNNMWSKIEDIDGDLAEWERDRCRPITNEPDTSSEQVVKTLAKLLDIFLFDNKEA